jgi:hypothetical protein
VLGCQRLARVTVQPPFDPVEVPICPSNVCPIRRGVGGEGPLSQHVLRQPLIALTCPGDGPRSLLLLEMNTPARRQRRPECIPAIRSCQCTRPVLASKQLATSWSESKCSSSPTSSGDGLGGTRQRVDHSRRSRSSPLGHQAVSPAGGGYRCRCRQPPTSARRPAGAPANVPRTAPARAPSPWPGRTHRRRLRRAEELPLPVRRNQLQRAEGEFLDCVRLPLRPPADLAGLLG